MDKGSNLYKELGVSPEATTKEIRRAWLNLCKEYHPDKAKNEEEARNHTAMMFKIHAAYGILSDETKRREYDLAAEETDDEESMDSDSSHDRQGFQEPPRAEPGQLGRPYQGPMEPTLFFYDCDGDDGVDAVDGGSGFDGVGTGERGTAGQDAGTATPGSRASNLKISIRTSISSSGYFQVNVHATRGYGEVMNPARPDLTLVPLKAFAKADFTARGGAGGRGGWGGRGGNGAKGYSGDDADEHSSGTDGGPGGDGGDGGRGSNGADGGRGGDVQIMIDLNDIYLLMRVAACDPYQKVQSRVSGGRGGLCGRHGEGGRGGAGGCGGFSYSWTETHTRYENGTEKAYTVSHHKSGGCDGRRGKDGWTYSYPVLRGGKDGPDGTFKICVESSRGTSVFSRRYDLTFQDSITKHLSDMPGRKSFEFGETVLVNSCLVKNSGCMPTPHQRAMIAFEQAEGVHPTWTDRIFLEQNSDLRPGAQKEADEGYLRYYCPFPPSLGTDYDPVRQNGTIQYVAHQLGPENETKDSPLISDFKEKYTHFQNSAERVEMAFPIENRAGILGVHSLGAQETTMLQLKLFNISNQSFGTDSKAGRALFVQIYYANDKKYAIPMNKIAVRGDGGHKLSIDASGSRGHREDIFTLPRRSDTTIQLTLKLDADEILPSATAGLQTDIYLQKIPTLHPDGTFSSDGKMQLIQRRLFVVSHQPKFDENKDSDVVLVTTTATTADQARAWETLVSRHLGLRTKVYSLSRYGHIDATEMGEEKRLREGLVDNLVVMLNEQFCAQPNADSERRITCRPSQLINSVFDFDESTRFLVVGGQADTVEHMSPRVASVNTIEAKNMAGTLIRQQKNRKSFLNDFKEFVETERVQGFAKKRVAPSCQVVQVKSRTLFRTPEKSRFEKTVERRSQRLQKWLAKKDKLRHYRVEWETCDKPQRMEGADAEKGWRRKCWHVGEFRIYVGSPRFQNSMVLLGEEPNTRSSTLSTPEAIKNLSTIHSVISAAPFETKMKCYCRSLKALRESPSQDHEEVCTAVRLSLVGDFLWDVSNYYQGRMKVESIEDRSPTLRNLLSSETFWHLINESLNPDAVAFKEVMTTEISMLLAGFLSGAESKDLSPWWSPLSRKHKARRAMREALKPLQRRLSPLVSKKVLDGERAKIEEEAKHHIKDVRGKFWLRARGRWREALAVAHSPSGPRQAARSIPTVRARREAEFEVGTSYKVKKLSAENADPQDSQSVRHSLHRRLTTSRSIREATLCDRNLYIKT